MQPAGGLFPSLPRALSLVKFLWAAGMVSGDGERLGGSGIGLGERGRRGGDAGGRGRGRIRRRRACWPRWVREGVPEGGEVGEVDDFFLTGAGAAAGGGMGRCPGGARYASGGPQAAVCGFDLGTFGEDVLFHVVS